VRGRLKQSAADRLAAERERIATLQASIQQAGVDLVDLARREALGDLALDEAARRAPDRPRPSEYRVRATIPAWH
jgi:hypothetical protein